jgi:uncharacterized protein YfiM (DUF2279 family)
MLRGLLFSTYLIFSICCFGQHDSLQAFKTVQSLHPKKVIGTSVGLSGAFAGSMIGLWSVWYSKENVKSFHTFNDGTDWLMTDKIGHFYTAYQLTQFIQQGYMWSGVSRKKSAWIGAGVSFGFQTTLEVFDGYSKGWGFSWFDMLANCAGVFGYLGQDFAWQEQRIIPKFSYHPTDYALIRPSVLGSTPLERLLKDYNGQTFWLSFSPARFFKSTNFPKWLCLSIGYSPDAKLVGDQNKYTDYSVGNSVTYTAKQQWLMSVDIDLTALPIKRKWLKTLVKPLNLLKLPFPTLMYTGNRIYGQWIYF